MKEAGAIYRKGLVSLAEASTLTKGSIYDMMEYVECEKIQAPSLTEEEIEEDLKKIKTLFKKL